MTRLVALSLALLLCSCASFLSNHKDEAQLHMQIGNGHYAQGNLPFALKEMLEAEKLDPQNPLIQNNLALIYYARERYDLAEQHLLRAIELEPKYSDARTNLGRVYIEEKRYADAEKQLRIAIGDLTYGGADRAWLNFGISRFQQQDFRGAKTAFEKSLQTNRESCLGTSYYGRSLFELEDYTAAVRQLDNAVGFCQKENFDEPHYFSALAWYRLGDKSKSMTRFEEILKLYPEGKYREKSRAMLDLLRKGAQ